MIVDELRERGIEVRLDRAGDQRTQCPQCSPQRHKKRDRCLSVTLDGDGATWFCHHCGWSGGIREADGRSDRLRQGARHQPGDFGASWRRLRNGVLPRPAQR